MVYAMFNVHIFAEDYPVEIDMIAMKKMCAGENGAGEYGENGDRRDHRKIYTNRHTHTHTSQPNP